MGWGGFQGGDSKGGNVVKYLAALERGGKENSKVREIPRKKRTSEGKPSQNPPNLVG